MAPERKRPTRSQLYQHLLVEKAFSHEMMETFSNDDSVYKKLNPFDYNEEILILEDQLKERFWKIINEHLTPRQLEIVKLLRDGATQQEAAKRLGVNQCVAYNTQINLSSFGNISIYKIYDMWQKDTSLFYNETIKCLDEQTNKLANTKIINIIKNDNKQLINITTASGQSIRTSLDHKFLTDQGWFRIKNILNTNKLLTVVSDNTVSFEKIINYELDNIEETYDIEVEHYNHNFVANNIIISNSSITKSINGNVDYSNKANNGKASYGGICKKLSRIVDKDDEIKSIMAKISDLRNDTWI